MRLGYACKAIGVRQSAISGCMLKNATSERLRSVIANNLESLRAILDYNYKNNIQLFRISSDIIPFASHPFNKLDWQTEFKQEMKAISEQLERTGIRVSMHPGQYTVLNSPDNAVVLNAIADIEYHCSFLDALGVEGKIILHIGGKYESKELSLLRFEQNYKRLSGSAQQRVVLENDEKCFTIRDVLALCEQNRLPAVFDVLHNQVNPSAVQQEDYEWIAKCARTWTKRDGKPKIHYSQQSTTGKTGAHAASIGIDAFMRFYEPVAHLDIDIMLEVKDKNLSALKCIHCLDENVKVSSLEKEWARYKYFVLSRSKQNYDEIRTMLKDKAHPQPLEFYRNIERSFEAEEDIKNEVNAASHVWGYFKTHASEAEKRKILKMIDELARGKTRASLLKENLLRLAEKYNEPFLLESLYFYL